MKNKGNEKKEDGHVAIMTKIIINVYRRFFCFSKSI